MRVLVVEDYQVLREALAQGLREAGYAVDAAGDGQEGLWYAQTNDYDVIVLDLMLPKVDGWTILKRLRQKNHHTAVLILTARDATDDRVRGLDEGADDYLVKPFAFAELLARVRALVRRRYEAGGAVLRVADLEIDTAARRVRRGGRDIALSAGEYAVLELLALRTGQVVSRTDMWEHLYDFNATADSNVVDVFVARLRKQIERDTLPRLIHTRRGQGYLLGVES